MEGDFHFCDSQIQPIIFCDLSVRNATVLPCLSDLSSLFCSWSVFVRFKKKPERKKKWNLKMAISRPGKKLENDGEQKKVLEK